MSQLRDENSVIISFMSSTLSCSWVKQPQRLNFQKPVLQPESRMDSFEKQLSETVKKYVASDKNTELLTSSSRPVQWANIPNTHSVLSFL